MEILFYLAVFTVSLIILVKSGSFLVHAIVDIAHFLHLSEYIVAFILMAFATSVPELFVGISSAMTGKAILSLGNIIGANIINLTLAVGIVIILSRGIHIENDIAKKDAWITFFLAILPLILILDGTLSRIDGSILILFFIWYVTRLLSRASEFEQNRNTRHDLRRFRDFIKSISLFGVGLVLILAGAWGSVWSASMIAQYFDISLVLIGLVLVAMGTTLPEIVFGWRSILMKHEDMTLGNFIGSVAFNSLFVLGIVALISPITVTNLPLIRISSLILVMTLLIFNLFIRTKNRLTYKEGIILFALYFFFLAIQALMI